MSEEPIERISVTATIEVWADTVKVSVNRAEGESLSPYARDLQTVMMLEVSKALKDFCDQGYEEDKS